ncbi:zinc-binding dehydrogenase [Cellulomonas hominis]|uniref:Zinc-binding dehydrogenase n=2 Tax=Cellulomonas hominis TaxID=156981 RepID=A0A7Z8NR40_9CELL|nr:zinc-binding dehydrogenase [Cellulomonas hominis]
MQAVVVERFGGADGLVVADVPEPTAGPGQVLIETEAIGVGGVDVLIRRGAIGVAGVAEGFVPGSELAGRVVAVGDGVDPGWRGRRVWAFTGTAGAYAARAVAGLDDITVLPDGLSSVDAVTVGGAGPVAHFALRHAQLGPGESVLVRGAAGSIGILAIQLAAAAGASTIGVTTSSPERGAVLRSFGAEHVLDRAGAGAGAPDEWDVIVDIVGGADVPAFLERLAPAGRMVVVGAVAGFPPPDFGVTLLRSFQRSLTFSTFSLDTVAVPDRNRVRAEHLASAAAGRLVGVVHDVLPLTAAAEAHRRMDAGEVVGRIVLTV